MTSESKHTPGPWEWLYDETHHDGIGRVVTAKVVDVENNKCVVEFSNTSHSEIVYEDDGEGGGSFFDFQARANARLISAAPDMYEALEAIIARWDTPAWKETEPTADVINRARSALLKAKGDV